MISEMRLEDMAKNEPKVLMDLIEEGRLGAPEMTYALEYLGTHNPHQFMCDFLFKFLYNPSDLVKEGAIYGIASILDQDESITVDAQKVKQLNENDPFIKKLGMI